MTARITHRPAFMWQHEETGNVGFIDQQQIEWGWQAANPRLKIVKPVFAAPTAVKVRMLTEPEIDAVADAVGEHHRQAYNTNLRAALSTAIQHAIIANMKVDNAGVVFEVQGVK
ncbi:MAG: hypothetical protein H7255_08845 [Ramlibacter sp.]|nr:hypothetical protein [Ramlibacter sp.]